MPVTEENKPGNHKKQMFGFRADARLAQQIEAYANKHELSESDTLRELVRKGLSADELEQRLEEIEQRLDEIETEDTSEDNSGWLPW